ncbi:MAG: M20/M25/M40 family metallo-hydrolase, partial [Gemmataceae bacterium]
HTLKAIDRICRAAAIGANAPAPEVKVNLDEYTPATVNNVSLTKQTVALFREVLGAENVQERPPIMGGEDFGRFGQAGVPIFMYFLGTIDAERYGASQKPGGNPLPSTHNDGYFPAPEASLRTGTRTLTLAALQQLGWK